MEDLAVTAQAAVAADEMAAFWRGKRVLLTGHSGFKGGWLAIWLSRLGAQVTGVSLPPATAPSLCELAGVGKLCREHHVDIRDEAAVARVVADAQPEVVFHLAAQPLVRAAHREPVATFSANVMGTVHVLEAARAVAGLKVVVAVTTDKVYANDEWCWPYREIDPLGGHDPYSASKAACEIALDSYRKSFLAARGVAVASARAGNVIGGGDWAPERLLPDAVRAWEAGHALHIRHPAALRPWQHVLDPLHGYLTLARALWANPGLSGAYNFGPDPQETFTVEAVVRLARASYGDGDITVNGPSEGLHEAGRLALDSSKARMMLGFSARWPLQQAVQRTMAWYKALRKGGDARNLCMADIAAFEATA